MADWCSSPSAPPSHEERRAGRAGINPATLSRLCIYPGPRLGERLQRQQQEQQREGVGIAEQTRAFPDAGGRAGGPFWWR